MIRDTRRGADTSEFLKKGSEKVQEELARICGLPEENVRITEKEAEQ